MTATLKDQINLLKHLNIRRVLNAFKVYVSYQLSRLLSTNWHQGMPIAISVEPTTSCNLRCPECPSGLRSFTRPTGMLDEALFQKGLDDMSKDLVYLILYFQGEPYLHPQFHQLVTMAKAKKLYVATSTNAHYLNDEHAKATVTSGLDRLIVSLDGTDQETYEQYRIGGALEKVVTGAKNIIRWRKQLRSRTPLVVFQFLVTAKNEHQIQAVKSLAKEIGVDDVWFKTAQVYEYENGHELIPKNNRYSRYRQRSDGKWELKNDFDNQCWKMWHSSVITWDGKVVPCCFDKDATHEMGNIKQTDFPKIWRGESYNRFRSKLLKSRSEIDICKNCTEGTEVWV